MSYSSVSSNPTHLQDIMDELATYKGVIDGLHESAEALSPEQPDVNDRLASIDRRYGELSELAELRRQKLLDALSLYKLYNEADAVEGWVNEKVINTINIFVGRGQRILCCGLENYIPFL